MSHPILEKFPDTGINQLATDGNAYTPTQWPEAIDFVRSSIRRNREATIGGIESVKLSELQEFAMNKLALPAIADTVSDVLGISEQFTVPGTSYVSLLASKDFALYHGNADRRLAGLYYSDRNQILINQGDHVTDSPEDFAYFIKVFIHEDFHYLSDQFSSLNNASNHLQIHRVGVHTLGEDIREKNKGELTWDYFVAFNEAITEKLAIEAYQKIAHDTVFKKQDGNAAVPFASYHGYRQLLDTVIEDVMLYTDIDLSKADLWHYIARGYLTGDVKPLMQLVRATYPGLSMREFGLITSDSELPQKTDFIWQPSDGGDGGNDGEDGRWTLSEEYLTRLRNLLNGKPSSDYISDVPPPPSPPSPAAVVYLRDIRQHRQNKMSEAQLSLTPNMRFVDRRGAIVRQDENGNTVHYDQVWLVGTLELLIDLSLKFKSGAISSERAGGIMDHWLFGENFISELSNGFEEFYVIKHQLLGLNTSSTDFNKLIEGAQQKLAALRNNT